MSVLSADTNPFLYAANPDSAHHEAAARFFASAGSGGEEFVVCELVLAEHCVLLRNLAFLARPLEQGAASVKMTTPSVSRAPGILALHQSSATRTLEDGSWQGGHRPSLAA